MMLAWLWIPSALAGSVHADQARIFLKRRYYDEALAEVTTGLADPTTADALDLYAIGVDAAWEVGDIDRVLVWSQQAADLTLNDDAHAGWQARHDAVAASWGWVTLSRATPGNRAPANRITVEPVSPVFDPEQKRIAAVVLLRLHDQNPPQARIALPTGEWRINGVSAVVVAGATTSVAPPENPKTGLRVDIGSAGLLLVGDGVRGYSPSVGVTLGISAPVGPIRVGGVARWSPQARVTSDAQQETAWLTGSAGLNASLLVPIASGVSLLPGVGVEADLLGPADVGGQTWGAGPAAQLALEWRGPTSTALGITVGGCWITGLSSPFPAGGLRFGAYLAL